ncbi:SAV_2336 N-terminal domain-related protein [Streptomyces sp. NPDC085524]|uniref:SAV_2336 N-terminal domain-related protein n=1 Tax=Streptomyces sp. NPDC085524 TaxID=3365728 RepID=UPI0037D2D589
MIEKLLAALAGFPDGAGDGAPSTGAGIEEIADILWLAARVDPAGARPPGTPQAGPGGEQPPAAAPPAPEPAPAHGAGQDGAEPAVRLYPAAVPLRDPEGKPAGAPDGTRVAAAAAGRRGTPLRLPRAGSLDDPLGLMRSLRPVGRRSIGGPGEELDEQLTVERSIEQMVPTPVLRPAESRWLDLALVVDTHHSMLLWADLVDELRTVLTRSGVFRDVRTWQLTGTASGATPMLTHRRGGPPRNPLELADPAGRRLLLVLSDTVAGGWCEAPLQGVLRHWSAHNAVAVLNVLPERLWSRGAVRPVPFSVRADRPAVATRAWQRFPGGRATRTRGTPRRRRPADGAAAAAVVPVVGLASAGLARLLRVVSGDGRRHRLACLRLDAEPGRVAPPAPGGPPVAPTALEAVERFRANASPTAQQLAAHLAAVPLTLPVMTLVRRSLLRDSEHAHLAEVALGGLFAPWGPGQDADEVEFEFLPGVREALLGSQLRGEVAAVRELVRRRVWEYMSRNRGPGPDFSATRVTNGRDGRRPVPPDALPFAARPRPTRPEPGLADRVVRVRYDTMAEPQEVGTLLTPRLVLTVGDDLPATSVVAWIRTGGREIGCRSVWWDEALPRVVLLRADEDLVDPAVFAEPLHWSDGEAGPGPVRVDGFTDQGERIALTGEVLPYNGARNGELVRLTAEPENWTQYRGGPVSRDGALIGIVHGVWPDRMVFLSGRALLDQPGFRDFLAAYGNERGEADRWSRVGLAVGACLPPFSMAPESMDGDVSPHPAGMLLDEFLRGLVRDTGAAVRVPDGFETVRLVTVDEPGSVGVVGRVLIELARRAEELISRQPWWIAGVAVVVGYGEDGFASAVEQARNLTWREVPDPIRTVLSRSLFRELGVHLGAAGLHTVTRGGGGSMAWVPVHDPAELGQALTEADELRREAIDWQVCDHLSEYAERCTGIRLPRYGRCLAHVEDVERAAYLGTLAPGAALDFRGTTFAPGLLRELLQAVTEPVTGRVRLGRADFDRARFVDDWTTVQAEFTGNASFSRAVFERRAVFTGCTFMGSVSFDGVVFQYVSAFERARFSQGAMFRRALFRDSAGWSDCTFAGEVSFQRAVLEAPSDMNGIRVTGAADFTRAVFRDMTGLHRAVFGGRVSYTRTAWERGLLSTGAVFQEPVAFDSADFRGRVRFESVSFEANTDLELPSSEEPDRWTVSWRPDGSRDIRLRDPGPAEEDSGSGA